MKETHDHQMWHSRTPGSYYPKPQVLFTCYPHWHFLSLLLVVCMCYACARVQVHTHNSIPMESEDNHPTGTSALLPPCFKAMFLLILIYLHRYSRQDRLMASGRFSCLHISTPLTRPCLEIHGCVGGCAYFFFLCFSLWKHSSNSQQQQGICVLTALLLLVLFFSNDWNRQFSKELINSAAIPQHQVCSRSPCLPSTSFQTCYTSALTSVLSARGSHFNKWNYTFKPDEVGLVIGPVQSLQFRSDLWKVWWIWQCLWGVVLKLQRERETFKISDIPYFVGSQKRPPSAGIGEKAHFQTI